MVKKLLLLYIFLQCSVCYAQTIKTDVLVIGGGASGVAAAIQSSRSKLKTVLVEQGPWLGGSMTAGGICVLDANRGFPSGIWAEFRGHIINFYKDTPGYDTASNATLRFEPYTGAAILKKITDTVKNLNVKLNTSVISIHKDGTGWKADVIMDNQTVTIKAKVVIDATETADIATLAGAMFDSGSNSEGKTSEAFAPETTSPKIQDITFVAIVKDNGPAADRTIKKPAGYNPSLYNCIQAGDVKKLLDSGKIVNDKYLINCCANRYAITIADIEPAKRAETYRKARLHTLGFIYYLQTVLGYKSLSLEEYNTPDKLPYIPYIREYKRAEGLVRMEANDIYSPYNRPTKLYRTGIAVADALPQQPYSNGQYPPFPPYTIPLGAVVVKNLENFLVTEKALSVTNFVNASTANPAVQMTLGQGAGTTAAFLAFFKTTTKNLNVRIIQGEILDHKGYIFPIADISFTDPYFRSVQQVCASGLLKGIQKTAGGSQIIVFEPDSVVYTEEIKPVLTELYTRTFIWLNKVKPGEKFTVGNLLSFISEITLADPENLQLTMQKDWETTYKFKTDFDAGKPVTRYEFAVLANKFLNPFARKVNLAGKVIN